LIGFFVGFGIPIEQRLRTSVERLVEIIATLAKQSHLIEGRHFFFLRQTANYVVAEFVKFSPAGVT
jgi:hypothetical protein